MMLHVEKTWGWGVWIDVWVDDGWRGCRDAKRVKVDVWLAQMIKVQGRDAELVEFWEVVTI